MIKAVAIDIDGTITDEKRRFNLEAIEKVREIEALGVPIILATGNILCFAEAACIFIGTSGPLIAENGGVVADPKTGYVRYVGDVNKVRRAFKALSRGYKVKKVLHSNLRKTEVAIYRDLDVKKIKEKLRGYGVSIVDTKFAIHIKDPKVNKGIGLVDAARLMGLDLSEIIAVGDSENDREMLGLAGYSISVGEKSLEDVTDYVTSSSFGEGGKEALEECISRINL